MSPARLPPSSRFWAQPLAFRMECPKCGKLLWVGGTGPHTKHYNRLACRLTCPRCHTTLTLALLAWPAPVVSQRRDLPGHPDQTLSLRHLAELRQYAHGHWMRERKTIDEAVNRYIDGECCCYPKGWREECPVHGNVSLSGEEVKRPVREQDEEASEAGEEGAEGGRKSEESTDEPEEGS